MGQGPIQFLLTPGLGAEELTQALAPSFGLHAEPGSTGERIFYDTFDGRLHRAGMSLAHDHGRFALRNGSGTEIAGLDLPTAPDEVLAAGLPSGQLRETLQPLTDVRAITPLACVHVRRRSFRVVDKRLKTVVRLALEEPTLLGAAGEQLTPRLAATGVRGYDKALKEVGRLLAADLALAAADASLQDEAVARSGHAPGGVSSNVKIALRGDEPTAWAAAKICQRLLEVIEVNLPGALADTDSEFLHDLRVAVRRTRTLQRRLRDAFPPESLVHSRAEFRWLQQVTGPVRDLDVYLLEFGAFRATLPERQRGGLERLLKLLTARRRRERRRMVSALRSNRTRAALSGWAELLADMEAHPGAYARRPVAQSAGARIKRVYGAMVRAGASITDASPPEDLHELRKQAKELRYLLEAFTSLYATDVIRPMVLTLKALQDSLGRFQDRQIQADLVHSLGEDVRRLPDGADALMAMGQLLERLDDQQAKARAEFAPRFADFASPRQRLLVREVFT